MTPETRKRIESTLNRLEDQRHPEPSPNTIALCMIARVLLSLDEHLEDLRIIADRSEIMRR
jgi:hypothetical protein